MRSPAVLREPRQERSRQTMERILAVTEMLLVDQPFEQLSVHQIVREAGTSVGAFYTRFRDKEALLPCLYDRYDRSLSLRMAELEDRGAWVGRPLPEIVTMLVEHMVRFFGERLYLMRALALYARTHPREIDADTRQRRQRQHRFLHTALLSCRDQIRHRDPERAVELALFFAASICRDRILFADAPHAASTGLSEPELVREVTRMVLAYLNSPPPHP